MIEADRRLYLTADRKRVVEEGDAQAAFLFIAPRQTIATAEAKRYGLTTRDGKVVLPGGGAKSEPKKDKQGKGKPAPKGDGKAKANPKAKG